MANKIFLNIENQLGPLEEKTLFLIEKEENVRAILKKINKGKKKYAYTTLMTVMDKLYRKGFLIRKKIGKTYFYQKVRNFEKVLENNNLYVINFLIKNLGRINFFYKVFYLIFIFPITTFLIKYSIELSIGIVFLTLITFFNLILSFYLNGFWEFLSLLIYQPDLLTKNFSLISQYLIEIIPLLNLIIFSVGCYLIKKLDRKMYYQFK
ncbi:MAG: BlaI/MecI/CopY family transcriptional regulator [Microgenomates group bacterium]